MKLMRKNVLSLKSMVFHSLGSAALLLILTAGFFALTILQHQFRRLARAQIRDKMEMVYKLIQAEIERLVELNADWGAWDETYQFVQGKNPQYITNNINPSSFATLDLHLLAYYDQKGNLFYAASYDPATQRVMNPDSQFLQKIAPVITNAELRKNLISGALSLINDEPYLVSAESILTSQHKGPYRGWLLMVRRLDLKPLMDLIGMTIEIKQADDAQICILESHLDKETHLIWEEEDKIAAQQKFYDVINERMNVVNLWEINEILRQGRYTVFYIIAAILISSLIIFFIIIVLLDNSIIKPIVDIATQLIGMDLKNIKGKIWVDSSSREFNLLTEAINQMLATIERQKEELAENEKRYRELVESAEVGIIIDDVDGNVIYFNEKMASLFGYTPEEFTRLKLEDYIHPEDLKLVRTYHYQRIRGEDAPRVYEIKGLHKDGRIIYLEVSVEVLRKHGQIVGTRCYLIDITARKKIEERLTAESMTDELTGLLNRRGFNALAQHQIDLSQKSRKGFYLFYCDVNNMKQINDRFGHATGDIALKETAQVLKRSFRKSDLIARVGGDEFIILAPESTPESINVMLERLNKNIKEYNHTKSSPSISLSIGYAYYTPEDSQSLEDLIKIADTRMYEEKLKHKKGDLNQQLFR
ncbi:MAG: diguanylate cyclase [candidate division WOR-3 bacterium]